MQTIEAPSFEAFYTDYWDYVRNILSRMLHGTSRNNLEDLVQETFLKAWRAYGRLDYGEHVPSWIGRIATNVGRDYLRHAGRTQYLDCSMDEEIAYAIPDPSSGLAGASLLYSGEWETISNAYDQLRPLDQWVFALLAQGYTHPEIRASLKIDETTCYTATKRARKNFRRAYLAECEVGR